MAFFKRILLVTALMGLVAGCFAQDELSAPVLELQDYCLRNVPTGYSPLMNIMTLTPKSNPHYLFPLYHALKDESKFRNIYSDRGFYDEVSQYFAFAGDYRTALQYLVKSYDTIDDATRRKIYKTAAGLLDIQHVNARNYIHLAAKNRRVVIKLEKVERAD